MEGKSLQASFSLLAWITAEEMMDQISLMCHILFCLLLEQDKQGVAIRYLC